uniref:Uncharacterized protein n=1 Tax=Oryza punctata TaxID=4537 RepID=A0A0E0LDP6_ORYPU
MSGALVVVVLYVRGWRVAIERYRYGIRIILFFIGIPDRSLAWWDLCSSADYPEADFRCAFRMSLPTFDFLCTELAATVAKEDTALCVDIPVCQLRHLRLAPRHGGATPQQDVVLPASPPPPVASRMSPLLHTFCPLIRKKKNVDQWGEGSKTKDRLYMAQSGKRNYEASICKRRQPRFAEEQMVDRCITS